LFEKYDEAARRSIFFARYEAYSREYAAIAPEHLLLGVLRQEAAKPSSAWPATCPPVSEMQAELGGRCRPFVPSAEKRDIPLTVESKRVILAAYAASERFGHTYVGVGHLLLGLLTYQPVGWTLLGVRLSAKRYLRRHVSKKALEAHVRTLRPGPTAEPEPAA
jgi:ATP-dependent Clp protease ATP-binding subunit ClpC